MFAALPVLLESRKRNGRNLRKNPTALFGPTIQSSTITSSHDSAEKRTRIQVWEAVSRSHLNAFVNNATYLKKQHRWNSGRSFRLTMGSNGLWWSPIFKKISYLTGRPAWQRLSWLSFSEKIFVIRDMRSYCLSWFWDWLAWGILVTIVKGDLRVLSCGH